MIRKRSRPARWNAAAADARKAYDAMHVAFDAWENALSDLSALKDEYEEWQQGLPENFQGGPLNGKLEAIVNMDLDILPDLGDCEYLLNEIEGADLPRGFGRD